MGSVLRPRLRCGEQIQIKAGKKVAFRATKGTLGGDLKKGTAVSGIHSDPSLYGTPNIGDRRLARPTLPDGAGLAVRQITSLPIGSRVRTTIIARWYCALL